MFELDTWLLISFVIALGLVTIVFSIATPKLLKSAKKIPISIGALILYTLSVSFVTFLYTTATSGGFLEKWQFLGFPSSNDKGVKVVEIGYVQTQSGNIYHWTNPYSRFEGQWEKVDEINRDPEFQIFPNCKSGSLSFLPIKRKDFIAYKEACISWGPSLSKTAYAIDNRGYVYLWFHGVGEYSEMEHISSAFFGGLGGCGFGLLLILNWLSEISPTENYDHNSKARNE